MTHTKDTIKPVYISLGSVCSTARTLIPEDKESLPFDSIGNKHDMTTVYKILRDLIDDKFDVESFIKIEENSEVNKHGFWFKHFLPPKYTHEERLEIFTRRFERLRNILTTVQDICFVYQKRERYCFGMEKIEPNLLKNVHDLVPGSRLYHFDRFKEIPLIKNEWYHPFHLVTYYPKTEYTSLNEDLCNLKNVLSLDVYNEHEKQLFNKKFIHFYKKHYNSIITHKTQELEEKNIQTDSYKQGYIDGSKKIGEYNLIIPDTLDVQYYYGILDAEKESLPN
jgi:hypothetical protein